MYRTSDGKFKATGYTDGNKKWSRTFDTLEEAVACREAWNGEEEAPPSNRDLRPTGVKGGESGSHSRCCCVRSRNTVHHPAR